MNPEPSALVLLRIKGSDGREDKRRKTYSKYSPTVALCADAKAAKLHPQSKVANPSAMSISLGSKNRLSAGNGWSVRIETGRTVKQAVNNNARRGGWN